MDALSPEIVFTRLQEKNQLGTIALGELLTVPFSSVIQDLTLKIHECFHHGADEKWLVNWFDEGRELLEDMPATAFLGPENSAGQNAYAIMIAAMMKVAQEAGDNQMVEACYTIDRMHTVGLPLFNLIHPQKQVQPEDKALYQELERISLKQMEQLLDYGTDASKELLAELGWKPLMRSGDEGWKIMHAREFLGLFFSKQLSLDIDQD